MFFRSLLEKEGNKFVPCVRMIIFVEKMNDMAQIYGKTNEIYFDDKRIYLVAE